MIPKPDEKRYCVYKHTSPSGKVYIGITCKKNPKDRWNNGKAYKNPYFNQAIAKYGWDNFKHEILAKDLSEKDAAQMEIDLIKQYRANDREYGYNLTVGGEVTSENHDYNMSMIRCRSNMMRGLWESGKLNETNARKNKPPVLNNIPSNKRAVLQYTKDGEFVARYESATECSKHNDCSTALIIANCNGRTKTAKGYVYKYETELDPIRKKHANSKDVYQFTPDGIFLRLFHSVGEAARFMNGKSSTIASACNGRQFTAYGYRWSYEER